VRHPLALTGFGFLTEEGKKEGSWHPSFFPSSVETSRPVKHDA
jgi:hypothetical protein